MEYSVSKDVMSWNDVASVEENEGQPECFTDEIILLNELDILGASLNGKKPCQLKVTQLKRWLACCGAPLSRRKPELIERLVSYYIEIMNISIKRAYIIAGYHYVFFVELTVTFNMVGISI